MLQTGLIFEYVLHAYSGAQPYAKEDVNNDE